MKIERLLRRRVGNALGKYRLINDGDSIAVGVSGGKDSLVLLKTLCCLRKKAPISYKLHALVYEPGFTGFYEDITAHLVPFFNNLKVEYTILRDDISKIISTGTPCVFCSRLRRGRLISFCLEKGFNKLALGHHSFDSIETLFMNMLYSGVMRAMPPKYTAERGVEIIRPMILCSPEEIMEYTLNEMLPVIKCPCPALENKTLKRARLGRNINTFISSMDGKKSSLIASLANLQAHTFADPKWLEQPSIKSAD
jgi:tRNA 2-thiocytidine biosynthesis protein TtcA